jgi:Tfp pilus assembly protein PilV
MKHFTTLRPVAASLCLSRRNAAKADRGARHPLESTAAERRGYSNAFSLVEVVISLGVITVGIVAILAVFPTALQTGHSAQDETRAAQIAQSVFGSLVAGASSQLFNAVPIAFSTPSPTPSPLSVDLTASHPSPTPPALYADNDGDLIPNSTNATYAVYIYTNNAPPGFTTVPATANQVTVRVAWPANAPAANQTFRDYVRIISNY